MIKEQSSTAEERAKANIYAPYRNYEDYKAHIIVMAVDLNNMLEGIPTYMIPDYWILTPLFRVRFKNLVKEAYYIGYESHLNILLPWCTLDLAEYAKRFKAGNEELIRKIKLRAKGIYD